MMLIDFIYGFLAGVGFTAILIAYIEIRKAEKAIKKLIQKLEDLGVREGESR